MAAASRRFRPPWWATVGVVAASALFCAAGIWQLRRAEQKQALLEDFAASAKIEVLSEPIPDAELEQSTFRPLRLTGRYDAAHQFLLDVMVHDGQVGYHVLTPLRRGGVAVLVNRGWLPADADRKTLPDVAVDAGEREISGLIAPLPRAGLDLAAAAPEPGSPWPRRLTFPSAEDIRGHLDYDVAGYQLLLDPDADDGFVRDWRPALMSPGQHLSYSVQWFGLAVALVIIFVIVNLQKTDGEAGE